MLRNQVRERIQDLLKRPNRDHLDLIFAEESKPDLSEVTEKLDEVTNEIRNTVKEFGVTRTHDLGEFSVINRRELLKLSGIGMINEIIVISNSPNFSVELKSDGDFIINNSFTNLQTKSSYSGMFDAYETADGKYVFITGNIGFKRGLNLNLIGEKIKFDSVNVTYNIVE